MMLPKAIMFDLYGTLVPAFRRREHELAIERCSQALGVKYSTLHQGWIDTFPHRLLGHYGSVANNFRSILEENELCFDEEFLRDAEEEYLQFTREGLSATVETLRILESVRNRGIKLALLSNCAPDVPKVWPETQLASFFDICGFSCELGVAKPDAHSYEKVIATLGISPGEILYIGDGSDDELNGAKSVGMTSVLLETDLSNTYDSVRMGVISWAGARASSLADALASLP